MDACFSKQNDAEHNDPHHAMGGNCGRVRLRVGEGEVGVVVIVDTMEWGTLYRNPFMARGVRRS